MIITCDIGGTKSRIAFSDDKANFLAEPIVYDSSATFLNGVHSLRTSIESELLSLQKTKKDLEYIVIGIAGVLDREKTKIIRSFHLQGWVDQPIKKSIEDYFNVPVYLVNDAGLAGLGECYFGAGRGRNIVSYVTVSTGVGGTLIIDGNIQKSHFGFEPGWQILDWKNGVNLETLSSGTSVSEKFKIHPKEVAKNMPNEWKDIEKALYAGLHNICVMWSPEKIVIGGSMSKDLDLDRIKNGIKSYMKIFPEIPEIAIAELGSFGGLYGGLKYKT